MDAPRVLSSSDLTRMSATPRELAKGGATAMTSGQFTCATIGPGSQVIIDCGPLQGVAATVVLAEDDESLTLFVSLLNGSFVVEVPVSGVVPVGGYTQQPPIAH